MKISKDTLKNISLLSKLEIEKSMKKNNQGIGIYFVDGGSNE